MMENQDRARVTMFLALLALVGIAVKFLTIAALHFVRPDANPVLEPIRDRAKKALIQVKPRTVLCAMRKTSNTAPPSQRYRA